VVKAQLRLDDDRVAEVIYDYFMGNVVPSVPVPTPEQFAETINLLAESTPASKTWTSPGTSTRRSCGAPRPADWRARLLNQYP
jgi:hypothetical protein